MDEKNKIFIKIVINTLIFIFLAIILGFLINYFIPRPRINETLLTSGIMLFIQLVISTIILLLLANWYYKITGLQADTFAGLTIFSIIFFTLQYQIPIRLRMISKRITGIEILPILKAT